jgi:hypothetical protein
MSNNKNEKRIFTIALVIGLLVGFGIGFWIGQKPDISDSSLDPKNKEKTEISTEKTVTIKDQTPGEAVTVSQVSVINVSWLAVREDDNGSLGRILGAVRLSPGFHSDITVPLLRGTVVNELYYVTIYEDDGDTIFDFSKDKLVTGASGQPQVFPFRTISGGSRGEIEEG